MNFTFRIPNYESLVTTGLGVGVAQIIALLSIPYIARLSGPLIFGEYSYYAAVAALACVFSSLKLEYAILVVSWRNYPYLKLAFNWLLPLTSLLFGFMVYMTIEQTYSSVLFIGIVFVIFSICQFEFNIQSNIRCGRFKVNAIMRVIRAVIIPLTFTLICFFVNVSATIILFSFAIGNITASVLSSRFRFKMPFLLFKRKVLKALWNSCRKVILYLVPAHFLSRYSAGVLVLIAGLLGIHSSDIAMYVLAEKLIIAPIAIITTAISDVVKRDILNNPISGLYNYYRLSMFSMAIALISIIFVYLFAEYLIFLLMGNEWRGIGAYAIALLPYLFSLMVFSPLTHTYTVLNKQQFDFYWQVFHAVLLSLAVIIGASYSFLIGLWCFSITAAVSIGISAAMCRYFILQTKTNCMC
jgi:O-antigen/teichoic acid export membrane protein